MSARLDHIPLQREWARLALGPYTVAAVVAALLVLRWRTRLAQRPLAARATLAVAVLQHIPYLPGIFAFGLPRALLGPGPLTDARVGFTVVSLVAALLALRRSGISGERRLLVLLVLLILPTGARYLVGGGDDVAVLALLLLAVVLEQRRLPVAAGLVAGLAAVVKQTAWLALPF